MHGPKKRRSLPLRFCPHTNDLLYPKEIPQEKKLIYKCKNCGYEAEIPEEAYCVYVNEVMCNSHLIWCQVWYRSGTVQRNGRQFWEMFDQIPHCQERTMYAVQHANTQKLSTSPQPRRMEWHSFSTVPLADTNGRNPCKSNKLSVKNQRCGINRRSSGNENFGSVMSKSSHLSVS
mgnify:CR=1 FL=1